MRLMNNLEQSPVGFCLNCGNTYMYKKSNLLYQLVLYLLLILTLAGTLGCQSQKKMEHPRENPLVKVDDSDLPEFTDAFFFKILWSPLTRASSILSVCRQIGPIIMVRMCIMPPI